MRVGVAEELPFEDGAFDVALCSLVVAFMRDAAAGAREMARVTRPGGVVAGCMWDVPGGGMTMLARSGARRARSTPRPRASRRGSACATARSPSSCAAPGSRTSSRARWRPPRNYADFDDFWEPFTFAVGPAGSYLRQQDADRQQAIRDHCFALLGEPSGPFELEARAWYARGTVPS